MGTINREKIETPIFSLCTHFYQTSNMWPNTHRLPPTCQFSFMPEIDLDLKGFPGGSVVKNLPANTEDTT